MNKEPEAPKLPINPRIQYVPTMIIMMLIVVAILSTGCVEEMKAYPGPKLPNQQVGILKMPQGGVLLGYGYVASIAGGCDILILHRIDGEKVFRTPKKVSLLPGQHTLVFWPRSGVNPSLCLYGGTWVKPNEMSLTVNVEAGKSYVAIPHYVKIDKDGKPLSEDGSYIRLAELDNPWISASYNWWVTIAEDK